jgi:hypothetical protein
VLRALDSEALKKYFQSREGRVSGG